MRALSDTELTDYVKEMAKELKRKYDGRNKLIEEVNLRRFMQKDPYVPSAYKVTPTIHKSSYVFDMVRRAAAIMSAGRPRPQVIPPPPGGPRSQEISSEWERWLSAVYEVMDPGARMFYKEMDSIAADGYSVCKIGLDRHSWGQMLLQGDNEKVSEYNQRVEKDKLTHFPFFKDFIPTNTYYPARQGGKPIEVLEITRRESRPLVAKYELYPNGKGKLTKTPGERVGASVPYYCECMEYTNDSQWALFVDGELVESADHEYGEPNYFEALALPTSSVDPTYESLPLVYPLLEIQDLVDSMTTIRINWAYWSAFPSFVEQALSEEAMPIDSKAKPKVMKMEMGRVIEVRPGYKFEALKLPPVGQELDAMHRWAKEYAEESSLAPILKGVAPGADVSNAAALTMIAAAKSVLGPAMGNYALYCDAQAAFIQENIGRLGTDVPIWYPEKDKHGKYNKQSEYLVLKPSRHLADHYIIRHHLEPIIPAEGHVKMIIFSDQEARGMVDKNYVREEGIGLQAPEDMELRVGLQKAREAPQYQQGLWEEFGAWRAGRLPPPPQPEMPLPGTPEALPIGPGGPGVPAVAGVTQPIFPGGPMATPPPAAPPQGGPM